MSLNNVVKILGCRGSVPVSGRDFMHFGGATCCIFLRLGGQSVILDGGTGLLKLQLAEEEKELLLLLSHPHVDHLLGLPMCPAVLRPGYRLQIWGTGDPEAQVRAMMGPPLWPVGPEELPSPVDFKTIAGDFSLGGIQVKTLEGDHPGGVTLFRLTGGGKSVAYLPDCTLAGEMLSRAADFARDCDLLLCDGQYSPEEWEACKDYGHSTWEMAARLGEICGAKRTRIIHHDPGHTDEMLHRAAAELSGTGCAFAYEGEEILL